MTVLLAAAAVLATAAAGAEPAGAPDLAWLSGQWRAVGAESVTEELWSCSAGRVLIGSSRTTRAGATTWFEQVVVRPDAEGRLTYVVTPTGQPSVTFTAVRAGTDEVLFANPANDFPKAVRYRREGETLTAAISADADGATPAQSWRYTRVATLNCG